MYKKILLLVFVIFLIGCNNSQIDISEAQQELQTRFQGKQSQMYKVDWKIISSSQETQAEMTQYYRGSDIRIDQQREIPFKAYIIDGELSSCAYVNVTWICQKGQYRPNPFELIEKDILESKTAYEVEKIEPKKVADVMTECYDVSYNTINAQYCFSEDNLLLFISQTFSLGSSQFEATSFSLDVSDEDFERNN